MSQDSLRRKLFTSDGTWWHQAHIVPRHVRLDFYANGYKDAADRLVELCAESRGSFDTFVYPIAFLYRQYLELRLKEIVVSGRSLLGREEHLKLNHSLAPLWTEVRAIAEELWPDEDGDPLEQVQAKIDEFVAVDPTSTAFRYPLQRDGADSIRGFTSINVVNLGIAIGEAHDLLEGISAAIEHMRDASESWA